MSFEKLYRESGKTSYSLTEDVVNHVSDKGLNFICMCVHVYRYIQAYRTLICMESGGSSLNTFSLVWLCQHYQNILAEHPHTTCGTKVRGKCSKMRLENVVICPQHWEHQTICSKRQEDCESSNAL